MTVPPPPPPPPPPRPPNDRPRGVSLTERFSAQVVGGTEIIQILALRTREYSFQAGTSEPTVKTWDHYVTSAGEACVLEADGSFTWLRHPPLPPCAVRRIPDPPRTPT